MYILEEILRNNKTFDEFIAALAHAKITNVKGSAYRKHPQMYYEDGVLITSEWNTNHYCDIKIASDPTAKLIPSHNSHAAYCDPYPTLSTGKWVKVWDGKWLELGPWVPKIEKILSKLIVQLEQYKISRENKKLEQIVVKEQEKRNLQQELIQNWSK